MYSLFDNDILSRKESDELADTGHSNNVASSASPQHESPKMAKIRHKLLSLFPPPELEDMLLRQSHWWDPWHDMYPSIFGANHGMEAFRNSVLSWKASRSITQVTRALLCESLTLQEAPGLNQKFHEHIKEMRSRGGLQCDPINLIEEILSVIDKLVLSDDELTGTMDGIECLLLQAKHDSNSGRIRKSWIYFRRGIFHAQLLGLYRRPTKHKDEEAQRRQSIWLALYQGDRIYSLLLGLPYAVSSKHSEIEIVVKEPAGQNYILQLVDIVGRVIDRNHEPSSNESYSETVKLEGEMTSIASIMPPEWWKIDPMSPDAVVGAMYNRLLPQFWHHQVRALLHLPYMLKASQDRRYEYNRIAALESAREMILRYQIFRPLQGYSSLICKIIDFQVFTAAMLLILNLIGSYMHNAGQHTSEDNSDWALVASTHEILQRASCETDGLVASQAERALGLFMKARNGDCPMNCGVTRVVIPYFGTVAFGPNKNVSKSCSSIAGYAHQPLQLATPAESISQTPTSDPFISFDSYLAQMPFDFTLGPGTEQPQQVQEAQNDVFANVNLDLDQDWAWYLQ